MNKIKIGDRVLVPHPAGGFTHSVVDDIQMLGGEERALLRCGTSPLLRECRPQPDARLLRAGWVVYPDRNGAFVEDLKLIASLVGSTCYEVREAKGVHYIRRIV